MTRHFLQDRAVPVLVGVLAMVFALPAGAQTGGSYDLSWNVIGGGGGRSRDGMGRYVLRGTIGQPAAGAMTGGTYELTGGFGAAPPARAGDANADGIINVMDLLTLAQSWTLSEGNPNFNMGADFNEDGLVDVRDLLVLASVWGT